MGVAELRRLRQREEENRKLKQRVADLTLDKQMLQEWPPGENGMRCWPGNQDRGYFMRNTGIVSWFDRIPTTVSIACGCTVWREGT